MLSCPGSLAASLPDQLHWRLQDRTYAARCLPSRTLSRSALQIINTDVEKTAFVTFASNITNTTASLVMSEQAAAVTIFNTCCNDTNSCAAWKAINQANDVTIYSDICHIPGQICDSDGAQLVGCQDVHFIQSGLRLLFPVTLFLRGS